MSPESGWAPWTSPVLHSGGESGVFSLMRINNRGSYLAPNNTTTHSCYWSGVQRNCRLLRAIAEISRAHYVALPYRVLIKTSFKALRGLMLNTVIVPMPPFISPKLFLEVLFYHFLLQLLMWACAQVHGRCDARHVQHQPSLQEEGFCDDCHRVGPGLRRLLPPAVRLQHHRWGRLIPRSSSRRGQSEGHGWIKAE